MSPSSDSMTQESPYTPHRDFSSENTSPVTAQQIDVLNKRLSELKSTVRPNIFTRPSNEDVTSLVNIGGAEKVSILPLVANEELQIPNQQTHEHKIMTASYPPRNGWRIASVCLWSAIGGLSDATPGALLPYVETYYNISYSIVSLIWISNAIGYILVATLSHKIPMWLGKRKQVTVGAAFSVLMYALVLSGGPFPLIVVAFCFGGIGFAIVLALAMVFLAKLDKLSKYMSYFHGCYGIGATFSPLCSTAMVQRGVPWHYYYSVLLSLMICCCAGMWFSFKDADHDLKPWDEDETEHLVSHNNSQNGSTENIMMQDLNPHFSTQQPDNHNQRSELMLALKHTTTWIISFWVLFYQGSEVSIGGWIVTFLQDYRGADDSSGYVASGFWGGLTFGRLFLTRPLYKWPGARRSITIVSLLTIVLVLLTWLVPNVVSAGVFISLAGVLIGPNYPLMITSVTQGMLPRKIQVVSVTIMTAFGSSGGALFPFLVGLISQSAGTYVVLPIFVAMYSLMLILWLCLPNVDKQRKYGDDLKWWQKVW